MRTNRNAKLPPTPGFKARLSEADLLTFLRPAQEPSTAQKHCSDFHPLSEDRLRSKRSLHWFYSTLPAQWLGAVLGTGKKRILIAGGQLSPLTLASMYSEIQRERVDIGGLMARPEYREWNPELIKPKKLINPVKASRSHQELHRELLMNHRRGLSVDSKPELQRVLEQRRRNQLMKKKMEELEAKRLQCPFEQELLRRQQRLNQLENPPQKEEDHAPEFIKVRENLRRIATLTSEERSL